MYLGCLVEGGADSAVHSLQVIEARRTVSVHCEDANGESLEVDRLHGVDPRHDFPLLHSTGPLLVSCLPTESF